MGAAYIRGFVVIWNSATVCLELWVICLELTLNKTKNMTIQIISRLEKMSETNQHTYLNMNVSDTTVV